MGKHILISTAWCSGRCYCYEVPEVTQDLLNAIQEFNQSASHRGYDGEAQVYESDHDLLEDFNEPYEKGYEEFHSIQDLSEFLNSDGVMYATNVDDLIDFLRSSERQDNCNHPVKV